MACVEALATVHEQFNPGQLERERFFCLGRIAVWGQATDSALRQYERTGIIAHKRHWEYCTEQCRKAESDLFNLEGGDPQMWDIDEW